MFKIQSPVFPLAKLGLPLWFILLSFVQRIAGDTDRAFQAVILQEWKIMRQLSPNNTINIKLKNGVRLSE